jgi:hypothetical protein
MKDAASADGKSLRLLVERCHVCCRKDSMSAGRKMPCLLDDRLHVCWQKDETPAGVNMSSCALFIVLSRCACFQIPALSQNLLRLKKNTLKSAYATIVNRIGLDTFSVNHFSFAAFPDTLRH